MKSSYIQLLSTIALLITLSIGIGTTQAQTTGSHIKRIDTLGLTIIYPSYTSVDLDCGIRPSKEDKTVLLMAEAAYTCVKPLRKKFRHKNIHGIHVSKGKLYNGTPFDRKTGAFVYYKNKYQFLQLSTVDTATLQVTKRPDYNNLCKAFNTAAQHGGMGFMQELIIHNNEIIPTVRKSSEMHQYRALCSHDGKLCIAESDTVVAFGEFKKRLHVYGVEEALYLDMGNGWNYAWYRDGDRIIELNPEDYYSQYCTNWIVFRRKNR